MEIEIKAKVFAHYLGQKRIWTDKPNAYKNVGDIDYFDIDNFLGTIRNKEYKLILKPLSEISDEDATELVKLHKPSENPLYVKQSFVEKSQPFIRNWVINNVINYQFLQALGYDLPHFLLGGKTLHEAGLCIYENRDWK
jgi:hypothetical protein